MKNSISFWALLGLTVSTALGTLFHFLYPWTHFLPLAPFCAANESTWEHMKILFFPMFFFAIIQSFFFGKKYKNFWLIKAISITLGTLLIPVLFYTWNGAFDTSPAWLNITFFFLAAGIGYFAEWLLFKHNVLPDFSTFFALLPLITLAIAFIIFTFMPPQLPLFQDPVTGLYGIV